MLWENRRCLKTKQTTFTVFKVGVMTILFCGLWDHTEMFRRREELPLHCLSPPAFEVFLFLLMKVKPLKPRLFNAQKCKSATIVIKAGSQMYSFPFSYFSTALSLLRSPSSVNYVTVTALDILSLTSIYSHYCKTQKANLNMSILYYS